MFQNGTKKTGRLNRLMQLTSSGVSMQRARSDKTSSHSKAVVKSYRLSSKTASRVCGTQKQRTQHRVLSTPTTLGESEVVEEPYIEQRPAWHVHSTILAGPVLNLSSGVFFMRANHAHFYFG